MIRFQLLGLRVCIHPSFWVAALLWWVLLTGGEPHWLGLPYFMAAAFIVFLTYELGHALAVKIYTGEATSLHLTFWGGLVGVQNKPKTEDEREMQRIALSGPVSGLLLVAALWVALSIAAGGVVAGGELGLRMLQGQAPTELALTCPPLLLLLGVYLVQLSVGWTALNLLPLYPLDGGKFLQHRIHSPGLIGALSIVTAALLAVFFIAIGLWPLAALMFFFCMVNYCAVTSSSG